MADIRDYTWMGYLRKDGRLGIRNKVLVIYTVECSSFVAKEIANRLKHNDVDVVGFSGCTDNDYAVRMLLALIRHPNIGGIYAVGLGCEYNQPSILAQKAGEAGKLSGWEYIQEAGGTEKAIQIGIEKITKMLEDLKNTKRACMGFKDLIIGAECGGSDYTSGLAGNVVVGSFFDSIVDWGGTCIFEEIVEAVGLRDLLLSRAVNDQARWDLAYTYDKALQYCKDVRQYSVSPGNFAGGLTTIEEKSMGAVIKSGSRPINGVIKVSQLPPTKGLWLLDSTPDPYWMGFGYTNPNDNEGLMDLIACGSHIAFLVTGRGNVVGSAVAPVIKITGNAATYNHMMGDMDFNAGTMLSGQENLHSLTNRLISMVLGVCKGELTNAEKLGHKEYFIPYKYQTPKLEKRCDLNG